MEVTFLGLQASTPLELYFETSIKDCTEHFLDAFVTAGYTAQQLSKLNTSIARLHRNPIRTLQVVRAVTIRCNCLKLYTAKLH